MAPSASFGGDFAVFEPVHGIALDIAGKGLVKSIASILSVKMMLEWLGLVMVAWLIEKAVSEVVSEGRILTRDLGGSSSTEDVGDAITERILIMINDKRKHKNKLQEMTEKKLARER